MLAFNDYFRHTIVLFHVEYSLFMLYILWLCYLDLELNIFGSITNLWRAINLFLLLGVLDLHDLFFRTDIFIAIIWKYGLIITSVEHQLFISPLLLLQFYSLIDVINFDHLQDHFFKHNSFPFSSSILTFRFVARKLNNLISHILTILHDVFD